MPDIDDLLSALLRGEQPAWPAGTDGASARSVIERAAYHGVLALLHDRLRQPPEAERTWPDAILEACREGSVRLAMWELRHRAVLRNILCELAAAGIRPVLFKGTALAYTLYPESVLRSRGDTDLIIPPQARAVVAEALDRCGFEREMGVSGESISYQASFSRSEPGGDTHTLDVHWRINNSELLSRLFSYEELLRSARPVPALGDAALAAGPLHALLLACMHRAAHMHNPYYVDGVAHFSGDRLIWLYDLHLLAQSFAAEDWRAFERMAVEKGLCKVCHDGLERARLAFHTSIPQQTLDRLAESGKDEILGRYLEASALRQQWMDFWARPGIGDKLRFLGETLLPPAEYMRHKYPDATPGALPWLYVKRAAGGLIKRAKRAVGAH